MSPTDHSGSGQRGIRRATVADLPSVRQVVQAAYARYGVRMNRPPAPVLNDYEAEARAGLIWVTGEPVAGLIVLVPDGDALMVENVAVDPSAQGTGIGRELMEFAERQAHGAGLVRMTLYTNEVMTENLAIYARLGYRETGRASENGYRRVYMAKELAR